MGMTFETLLGNVTAIVTAMIGWLGSFVQAVEGHSLLLVFVLVSLCFTGVALFRKLLRV